MIKGLILFSLGFLSSALLFFLLFFPEISGPTGLVSLDLESPSDWVKDYDIIPLEDRVVLLIDNASISEYTLTGSMGPWFGEGANGIRIVPKSSEDVDVGDIISFKVGGNLVVHRVVEKGFDEKGVYFIAQGDNNYFNDGKIRFEQIEYVTIGVLW